MTKMERISYKCPDGEPDNEFESILIRFMKSQGWKLDGTGMNFMTDPWTRDVWFYKRNLWDKIKRWIAKFREKKMNDYQQGNDEQGVCE